MSKHRVSLQFARLSDASLATFADSVVRGLTDNPAYPAPAVPLAELAAQANAFKDAMAASDQGGKAATAAKNDQRALLDMALRTQAFYVQNAMKNNVAVLLSSGYQATAGRAASEPLVAPAILRIDYTETTRLALKITPVAKARAYEVRKKTAAGEWVAAGIGTKSRKLEIEGLVPGTVYQFQVRAIGGSTSTGPWSDAVQHMAT